MIRIEKAEIPPEILLTAGKRKRRKHASDYSRHPEAYQSGRKFEFDQNIYAHPSVKEALNQSQHKKCCFCETLIGTDGDIEHFRPKQASRQTTGSPLQYPGLLAGL